MKVRYIVKAYKETEGKEECIIPGLGTQWRTREGAEGFMASLMFTLPEYRYKICKVNIND